MKRVLDSKLRKNIDAQKLNRLQTQITLMAQTHEQAEADHTMQLKAVQDELKSVTRLKETFEQVNGSLQASTALTKSELDQLRRDLQHEAKFAEAVRQERDAAREEADKAGIERAMYERLVRKLQARVQGGFDLSSDDEGLSGVEMEMREKVVALEAQVEHERLRKHQLFQKLEQLREKSKKDDE